jgi:hypothetical protein
MSSAPVITAVHFEDLTRADELAWLPGGHLQPKATLSDGSVVKLPAFFSDELYWTEAEFLGRTESEARARMHAADVRYLQS